MKYKGIIFDFNGVLLWDTDWHTQSWQETALKFRGTLMSKDELENHHGRTNREFLAHLIGKKLSNVELSEKAEFKENIYRNIVLSQGDKFALSPGAGKLLDTVVEHSIPHAIATSSPWSNTDFFIRHLDLHRWFDTEKIVFDDGTIPGKPAPDLYLKAAKAIGLPPAECVIIEDAKSGIMAARNAHGGKIIAVGPKEKHAELRAWGADQTVQNLGELSLDDF